VAVVLGFAGLVAVLAYQFRQWRYRAWTFYWAAAVATFAMGTAVGDFTANTLKFGYRPSAAMFAGLILIPLLGWRLLRWNQVLCFWSAYVLTRPLGASVPMA
jgi:uncharacterized membrane-anchored protein